jgi:hypothetical protein
MDMTISIILDPSSVAHHSAGKLTKESTQPCNQETTFFCQRICHAMNGQTAGLLKLDSNSQLCSRGFVQVHSGETL